MDSLKAIGDRIRDSIRNSKKNDFHENQSGKNFIEIKKKFTVDSFKKLNNIEVECIGRPLEIVADKDTTYIHFEVILGTYEEYKNIDVFSLSIEPDKITVIPLKDKLRYFQIIMNVPVNDINLKYLVLKNHNGKVLLKNMYSELIDIDNKNGGIVLNSCSASSFKIENINDYVILDDVKVTGEAPLIKCNNKNGDITISLNNDVINMYKIMGNIENSNSENIVSLPETSLQSENHNPEIFYSAHDSSRILKVGIKNKNGNVVIKKY